MPIEPNSESSDSSPDPKEIRRNFLFWLMILLCLNLVLFRQAPNPRVPYSEFLDQVESGQVARVEIGSTRITYELRPNASPSSEAEESPAVLTTTPVPSDVELPKLLREHRIEFSAQSVSEAGGWFVVVLSWLLPLLLFLGIWSLLMNRQGGGPAALTVGKSKARIYSEGSTGVTFDDVAGVDEAKTELREIVDFLKHADKYTRLGAKIPKGVLLVGPPGTGKTLLARAIAGEAGVPFFSISGAEFIELFVGVGAARVRDLFEQAKQKAPCIVFIDELDALGKSRAAASILNSNDEREQTLNQLLSEMDGFDPNTGVILLAATNRPEVLDPALRRPGRFDRQIIVDRPDKVGREAILHVHTRNVRLSEDIDMAKIAARTPGFAGADLANLVNEAALLAARQNHPVVTMADFNEALERLIAGLEKKSRVLNDLEKQIVAYHEVGHAITAVLMPGAGKVEKISVVPRSVGALGYTLQLPEEDRFLMTEDEIRGRIATLLGGRAAEELIFGRVSTGASDDIQRVTDLAERYVTLYGMSTTLGPVALEKPQQQFLEGITNPRRAVSPQLAETIDHEVKALIDSSHYIALCVLKQNSSLLDEIARVLLDHEVLEGDTLQHYLKQVQHPTMLQEWLQTGCLPHDVSWINIVPNGKSKDCSIAAK
jgi:cell division protease FtsH